MDHNIDVTEKECSNCETVSWVLPNGLCMDCHNKNLK